MARKTTLGRDKNGRFYAVNKSREGHNFLLSLVAGIVSYLFILAFAYGVLSFNRPDLVKEAFENQGALVAMLIGVGFGFVSLSTWVSSLGAATFAKESSPRLYSTLSSTAQWLLGATGIDIPVYDEIDKSKSKGEAKEEADAFSYGAASDSSSFEIYISSVQKSISLYASRSEDTASKLLEKGVAFMAGGLVFYVVAIVLWQFFANLTKPDSHMMYVGMAACSMTFIVVEFLAAWFFKQYRYYVEVSLSCLRVRSVYDRYLLGYYALREFEGDGGTAAREQMAKILKEDVNWPDYKGGVANDFNYMIESMGAAHTSMEKMKGVFQPKKKTKPNAEQV